MRMKTKKKETLKKMQILKKMKPGKKYLNQMKQQSNLLPEML